jgi:hypothetical protein
MKPDLVIVVPANLDPLEMLHELTVAAETLIEKHMLQSPVSTRVLDGHGNQFLTLDVIWDENGNPVESKNPNQGFSALPQADGLFLLMEDSKGKTVTAKLEIEGQHIN